MFIEPWLNYSLGSSICSSAYSLSVKKGDQYTDNLQLTSYFLLLSSILCFIYILTKKIRIPANIILNGGTFWGLSLILLNKSISESKNPGLSMGLFRTQAILTYLLSVFIFKTPLSIIKFCGVITVVIGAFIVTEFKINTKKKTIDTNKNKEWVIYALTGAIFMSLKDIFTRRSITENKTNIIIHVFKTLTAACIISFVYQFMKTKNLKLESKQKNKKYHKYFYLLVISLIFIVASIIAGVSTNLSPNPGLAKAIDSLGIVLTLIISRFLFKNSKVSKKQWLGVFILIIGEIIISS